VRNSLVGDDAVASVLVFLRCGTPLSFFFCPLGASSPLCHLSAWLRKRKGRTEVRKNEQKKPCPLAKRKYKKWNLNHCLRHGKMPHYHTV